MRTLLYQHRTRSAPCNTSQQSSVGSGPLSSRMIAERSAVRSTYPVPRYGSTLNRRPADQRLATVRAVSHRPRWSRSAAESGVPIRPTSDSQKSKLDRKSTSWKKTLVFIQKYSGSKRASICNRIKILYRMVGS